MKTQYHLELKGYVGGYDFDRATVDSALKENAQSPVMVLIDSLGGSLAHGLSISASFRNHGDVTVHFVGLNASAATIASLGAKRITMDRGAMYLVHKCSTGFFEWASLNADEFEKLIADITKTKNDLDKLDQNVAQLYAAKCKRTPAEMLELMKAGGWLTSDEALAWGFVDEITDLEEDEAPLLTDAAASIFAAEGIPMPDVPAAPSGEGRGNLLSQIVGIVKSLFPASSTFKSLSDPMKKTYRCVCALLAVDAFTMSAANQAQLTDEQLTKIEDAMAKAEADATAAQNRIAELEARVAELEAEPAAKSQQVVEDSKKASKPETDVESFVNSFNSAKKLFDRV